MPIDNDVLVIAFFDVWKKVVLNTSYCVFFLLSVVCKTKAIIDGVVWK